MVPFGVRHDHEYGRPNVLELLPLQLLVDLQALKLQLQAPQLDLLKAIEQRRPDQQADCHGPHHNDPEVRQSQPLRGWDPPGNEAYNVGKQGQPDDTTEEP